MSSTATTIVSPISVGASLSYWAVNLEEKENEVEMKDIPIACIGGGNMARSLIGGLIADGYEPDCIWVAEPDASQREFLRSRFGVHTGADNPVIAAKATVIVLAVKPQLLQGVAQQLAAVIQGCPPLVISIAAGVRELDLRRWLGGGSLALVRTMPKLSLIHSEMCIRDSSDHWAHSDESRSARGLSPRFPSPATARVPLRYPATGQRPRTGSEGYPSGPGRHRRRPR